jgi:tRNA-splicing ligase RtcB
MSASHGAGRVLARGEAMRGYEEEFKSFMERFRVVTPIDLRRVDVRSRKDILERKLDEIRQEAPYAYKGIGPVIETLTNAGMAKAVAELVPLMTMKG